MIVAHLSELHLGFRAYEKAERGRNVREQDVARAFSRALDDIVRREPAVILIAGDVFDRADPSPAAMLAFTRAVGAVRAVAREIPVALVAGARDTPLLPGDAGLLPVLETLPGVFTASGTMRVIDLEQHDLRLCLLPYRSGVREPFPTPRPNPDARWNVALAFGAVSDRSGGVLLRPDDWDYVALGGQHRFRRVAERATYSGSLERVGSRPWREAAEEKGYVSANLDTRAVTFHPVAVRPVVAMAPVRMPPGGREALPARMREVTDEIPGGIERKIVHLAVRDARPRDLLALQGDLLVGLRRRALHLEVGTDNGVHPEDVWPAGAAPGGVTEASDFRLEPKVRADDPLLGKVEVDLPVGLIAVVSLEPGATRRFLDVTGPRTDGAPWLVTERGSLRRQLEGVVAAVEGGARDGDDGERPRGRDRTPAASRSSDGSDELERLEQSLHALRGDHAELAGDVEVATMEWLRERQDAETNLRVYRDRARELKARLTEVEGGGPTTECPTCSHPLADRYDDVAAKLRDEWEAVVMDGKWWKRRREQLEFKPDLLRELEGRAVRSLAAVEACAEEVEAARLGAGRAVPLRSAGSATEPDEANSPGAARGASRELVLEAASSLLCRITGSRALALVEDDERVVIAGPAFDVPLAGEAEVAAGEVALRLTGALLAGGRCDAAVDVVIPEGVVETLRDDDRLRLLDTLSELEGRFQRVLVALRPESAERRPELLHHVLEVRLDPPGSALRWLQAGESRIRYRASQPSNVPSDEDA